MALSRRPCSCSPRRYSSIKAAVVDRLRNNLFTKDCELRVGREERGVVILAGVVDSRLAKRSAGDDCWDTVGVTDVSNQLEVAEVPTDLGPQPISDIMTTGVVALEAEAPLQAAAAVMRDSDVGSVVEMAHGNVIGIVTDRDIVVRAVAEGHDAKDATLGDIATDRVITMGPDDPVELARVSCGSTPCGASSWSTTTFPSASCRWATWLVAVTQDLCSPKWCRPREGLGLGSRVGHVGTHAPNGTDSVRMSSGPSAP